MWLGTAECAIGLFADTDVTAVGMGTLLNCLIGLWEAVALGTRSLR